MRPVSNFLIMQLSNSRVTGMTCFTMASFVQIFWPAALRQENEKAHV